MISIFPTTILAVLALTGAWLDITARRLPNWLCLVTGVTGLTWVALTSGGGPMMWAAIHAGIALVVGMALFRFALIGGGDAKFYAACAAWFDLRDGLQLISLVSVTGLALVMVWFSYRQASGARREANDGKFALMPYGVAIGIGAVAAKLLA